jgi:hypothetical protein
MTRSITSAAELKALPEGAVVLDAQEDVWQRRGGEWCSYESAPEISEVLAKRYSPFEVLSPSGEDEIPDIVTPSVIELARWLTEHNYSPGEPDVAQKALNALKALQKAVDEPVVAELDETSDIGFELALRIAAVTNAARAWGVLAGAGGAERGVEILTQSLNTRAEWLNEYLEATFGVSLPEL